LTIDLIDCCFYRSLLLSITAFIDHCFYRSLLLSIAALLLTSFEQPTTTAFEVFNMIEISPLSALSALVQRFISDNCDSLSKSILSLSKSILSLVP